RAFRDLGRARSRLPACGRAPWRAVLPPGPDRRHRSAVCRSACKTRPGSDRTAKGCRFGAATGTGAVNWLAAAYSWLKALHIIAVIAWMAGLLYLPRLFRSEERRVGKEGAVRSAMSR